MAVNIEEIPDATGPEDESDGAQKLSMEIKGNLLRIKEDSLMK